MTFRCQDTLSVSWEQHLFTKGRIENIFTDELYGQFSSKISAMLRHWKPHLLPTGTTFHFLLLHIIYVTIRYIVRSSD